MTSPSWTPAGTLTTRLVVAVAELVALARYWIAGQVVEAPRRARVWATPTVPAEHVDVAVLAPVAPMDACNASAPSPEIVPAGQTSTRSFSPDGGGHVAEAVRHAAAQSVTGI